jgi:exodeoxyribonuclease-3
VKVATFNINNINKRLDNLMAWLAKAEPDVVSLQELKAEQEAFPVNALRTFGYEALWQGERSWNGVAILARNHVPVLTRTSLPRNPEGHFSENRNPEDHQNEDQQARYIEAAVQGVLISSIYLPNGNPQPGPKFNYKLAGCPTHRALCEVWVLRHRTVFEITIRILLVGSATII